MTAKLTRMLDEPRFLALPVKDGEEPLVMVAEAATEVGDP
jgi:hypothetical protein